MSAVPASDSPMLRTLPDGTSIEIMLHGDENFHYATLLDGSIVKQGDDGYFYYAEVTADGIVATPYKVGDNVPKQRVVKSTGVRTDCGRCARKPFSAEPLSRTPHSGRHPTSIVSMDL